jgi:alpha-1,3-glucan synthase
MGDLIGFDGFLNKSATFSTSEYKVQWRSPDRRYFDFSFGNDYNKTCDYPKFWNETGFPVGTDVTDQFSGCYDSEFDQVSNMLYSRLISCTQER